MGNNCTSYTLPTCEVHKGEAFGVFCKTCGCMVCRLCRETIHKDHETVEASEAFQTAHRDLRTYRRELSEVMAELDYKVEELDEAKTGFEQRQMEARQALHKQKQTVYDCVEDAYQRQVHYLDHLCRSVRSSIQRDTQIVEKRYEQAEKALEEIIQTTAESETSSLDALTLHARLQFLEERLDFLTKNLPDPASADRSEEKKGEGAESDQLKKLREEQSKEAEDKLRSLVSSMMHVHALKSIDVEMDVELVFQCCSQDDREEVRTLFPMSQSLVWTVAGRPGAEGFLTLFEWKGLVVGKRMHVGKSRVSIVSLNEDTTVALGQGLDMTRLKDDGKAERMDASVVAVEMQNIDVLYSKRRARFQLKVNHQGDSLLYKVAVTQAKSAQNVSRVHLSMSSLAASTRTRSATKLVVKKVYHEKICMLSSAKFPVAFDASRDGELLAVAVKELDGVLLYRTGDNEPCCTCDMPCCRPRDLCFMTISQRERLVVADPNNSCLHILDVRAGDSWSLLGHIGTGPDCPAYFWPTAICPYREGSLQEESLWVGCRRGHVFLVKPKARRMRSISVRGTSYSSAALTTTATKMRSISEGGNSVFAAALPTAATATATAAATAAATTTTTATATATTAAAAAATGSGGCAIKDVKKNDASAHSDNDDCDDWCVV